ncbi:MAG: prepilin-type N-terminal cleavage/methylation domain-containing protein, partial [Nitrospirae bacterium]|nr:prepilin-type N-terminal cleavage/methylation domain-containing protein [Nitrospirota bacterium]
MRAQGPNEEGFTLVEMMITAVISAVIIGAGLATLTGGNRATIVSNVVADTQQNVRAAMDLIAADLKVAGFGMIGQIGACAIGGNAAPLVPQDNTPGGADTGPDRVSMVVPITNTQAAPFWQVTAPPAGPGIASLSLPGGAVTAMQA